MSRPTRGFTLIEILVVLSLLGVLMGLSVGFVQRMGRGNELIQAANSAANVLASARAQAYGDSSAYVTIEAAPGKPIILRSFRNRQVFHWPCEDFDRASELDVLHREGGVDMAKDGPPSREGRHVVFGSAGRVTLRNTPWLQFVDGFSIQCRVFPQEGSTLARMPLFQKGSALQVGLSRGDAGRYDVYAVIRLRPDEKGEGAGTYELRTGQRGPAEVVEWKAPLLAGRWYDLRVSYDRNSFEIYVNGSLRAARQDRRNAMQPDMENPFVIGGGYAGGFDSLVIGGIYEDDDDRFEVSESVRWLDAKGDPILQGRADIHFRNRGLDPREHAKPVDLVFELPQGEGVAARRIVNVGLSGETFVRRPTE